MQSLKINKTSVYCFDPKYKTYMKMGHKIGDTFFKQVKAKNFMRVVNGYGLQYDAYIEFESAGIIKIVVLEENGNSWMSNTKTWLEHGKIADYGRGKQIFLSMKYMSLKDKAKLKEEYETKEIVRGISIQEALFGV